MSDSTSPQGGTAAVIAGFLGWTLDAFDFLLVALSLKSIGKTFGVDDDHMSWVLWATLLMRPIGAVIFGLLADRYGRRRPLMINLVFYSSMSILSGMAPTYWTFFACRLLFGVGMGGEWGVGTSLALEKVSSRYRGLLSGLLQEGYATGNLLASAASIFLYPVLEAHFPNHGWRPLFFIGGLPALLALMIRSHVPESEVWKKTKAGSWSDLGTMLPRYWKLFLMLLAVMFLLNSASHGTQDLFPKFLTDNYKLTKRGAAAVNAVGAIGSIIGGIFIGYLSDRIGRRWPMVGCFVLATAIVPIWAYAPSLAVLVVATFTIQFFVQGAWGVIPAYLTEMSPDSVRGFLPGFAYQCGAALSGVILVTQTTLEHHIPLANAMAGTAAAVFVTAAIVIGFCTERRGYEFGSDANA